MRFGVLCSLSLAAVIVTGPARGDEKGKGHVPDVLNFKMKDLQGKEVDLSQYQGKVVLFVNVASQCGYTPQYKGLESLYEKFKDRGLVVIGVPSNEFGGQEPGTDQEIADFCKTTYNVTFPVLTKTKVKIGEGQNPLYQYLTDRKTDPKHAGNIKWNFTKFLIGRDGHVAHRFEPNMKPESETVVKAVEAELGKE